MACGQLVVAVLSIVYVLIVLEFNLGSVLGQSSGSHQVLNTYLRRCPGQRLERVTSYWSEAREGDIILVRGSGG